MSYQQCPKFRTTLDFDGTDQAIDKRKAPLSTTILATFDENNRVNFGQLKKK